MKKRFKGFAMFYSFALRIFKDIRVSFRGGMVSTVPYPISKNVHARERAASFLPSCPALFLKNDKGFPSVFVFSFVAGNGRGVFLFPSLHFYLQPRAGFRHFLPSIFIYEVNQWQ